MTYWKPSGSGSEDARILTQGMIELATRLEGEEYLSYLITFLFREIPGNRALKQSRMRREIERAYSLFAKHDAYDMKTANSQARSTILIALPDFPVPKQEKMPLRHVLVNDGMHFGGIAFQPPCSRLRRKGIGLDRHFTQNQACYVRSPSLVAEVNAVRVTETLHRAVDYTCKAVQRGWCPQDDLLILPQSRTECL